MLPLQKLPVFDTGPGFQLLAGVSVLDLSSSIAGPYASLLLADMGAEVIKIERPHTGDDARHWGPPFLDGQSLWFLSANRNKHSLTLDYANPQGYAVLVDLIRRADMLLCNQVLRVQQKLGVDYPTLADINPRLIHTSITGFGLSGERANWACYDLIAEGYSGVMDLTGEIDGEPQKVGTPAADMLAGMDAAFATVAALYERQYSGHGHQIDISLVESMSRFMTPRLVSYLGSDELPRRSGGKDSVIAIYQTFQTADEPITLGLGNDAIWQRFWQAVGQPERSQDPHADSNAKRRAQRAEIVADIQEILLAQPRAHWLELFAENRVPAGPINRLDEVVSDPHLLERGLFYQMNSIPQINTGIRLDERANQARCAPPGLGQDTETILRERLGYGEARIADLREQQII